MSLIINDLKRKPFLGNIEIGEVWLGSVKIYPEIIIIKHYEELTSSGYYHDLVKVAQNRILFGTRAGVKYYNPTTKVFTNSNLTTGAWARFVEAVDGNIYVIGYNIGSQSGLQKYSGGFTAVTLPATASFHNYINAVDGNTYLLSSSSGIQKIDSNGVISLTTMTAGQYNFVFNSELYNKTFFVGNTTGIKYINTAVSDDILATNITSGKGANSMIEYDGKLFAFYDSGVRVWDDLNEQFTAVTATSGLYLTGIIASDGELYVGTNATGVKKYDKTTNAFVNTNLTTGSFREAFNGVNGITYFPTTAATSTLYYLNNGTLATTGITSTTQRIKYVGDIGEYSYFTGANCWYRIHINSLPTDITKTVDFNGNTPFRIEEIDGMFYVTSYLYDWFNGYENVTNYAGVGQVF